MKSLFRDLQVAYLKVAETPYEQGSNSQAKQIDSNHDASYI